MDEDEVRERLGDLNKQLDAMRHALEIEWQRDRLREAIFKFVEIRREEVAGDEYHVFELKEGDNKYHYHVVVRHEPFDIVRNSKYIGFAPLKNGTVRWWETENENQFAKAVE